MMVLGEYLRLESFSELTFGLRSKYQKGASHAAFQVNDEGDSRRKNNKK